jgi:hypothetical protein
MHRLALNIAVGRCAVSLLTTESNLIKLNLDPVETTPESAEASLLPDGARLRWGSTCRCSGPETVWWSAVPVTQPEIPGSRPQKLDFPCCHLPSINLAVYFIIGMRVAWILMRSFGV